jgi:hypothetical protein
MTTPKFLESPTMPAENSDAADVANTTGHAGSRRRMTSRKVRKVKATPQENKKSFLSKTAIPLKAAKHEAGTGFLSDSSDGIHEAMMAADRELYTEETASDVVSSINSTASSEYGHYEVIEYDFGDPDSKDASFNYGNLLTLSPTRIGKKVGSDVTDGLGLPFPDLDLVIQDDSPAAEALRANANIHVSSAGKAARAVHLQSIRRLAKFAAGANKTGYVKGKPPRLPPPTLRQMEGPFGGPSNLRSLLEVVSGDDFAEEYISENDVSERGDITEKDVSKQQAIPLKELDEKNDYSGDSKGIDSDQGKIDPHDDEPNAENSLIIVDEKIPVTTDDINLHRIEQLSPVIDQQLGSSSFRVDDLGAIVATASSSSPHGVSPGTIEAGQKGLCRITSDLSFVSRIAMIAYGLLFVLAQ